MLSVGGGNYTQASAETRIGGPAGCDNLPAMLRVLPFFVCGFGLLVGTAGAADLKPLNLRCEYRQDPLGVDIASPRLSWQLSSEVRGAAQSAYEIVVASTPAKLQSAHPDLWDSGRVSSDQSVQIPYQGVPLSSRTRCYWRVRSWDGHGAVSPWSKPALWTMGLLKPQDWSAKWIGVRQDLTNAPVATPEYLRKEFRVSQPIRRATLYATALGLYELHLNGNRVGDHLLAPEWTMYDKRVQYQTYDVTRLVQSGNNAIAATLGNGWYCGLWQQWTNVLKPVYGKEPSLLAQLEVEFADGTVQKIGTDATWRGATDGPLRFSGIYEGETYDARCEMPGWDKVAFDDHAWASSILMNPKVQEVVWQRSEPIRVSQDLPAIKMTEPKPGVYVFDLGQNMAGWCRLRLHEKPGVTVTLKHNEVLNPDGTVYLDNLHAGHLSTGDRQIVRYTCRGNGVEVYEPHFTYQGFRYVEVSGLTSKPDLNTVTGRVFHTAFTQTGAFTCSNPLLNRLALNIQWSQRANMMGVPTDCCQRDERCGYTGDAQFFIPSAVYNFDISALFSKWLVDVCEDSQRPDGGFSDHAPDIHIGISQNVGWSDAGIICPYVIYRTYGDTRVISDHYAAMKRNLDMLVETSNGFTRGPDHVGNGDWLSFGAETPKEVIGTAYYAYVFGLMAEMAEVIGKQEDAQDFAARAAKIRTAFAAEMVDQTGYIRGDTQTDYALAFTMALTPDTLRSQMAGHFEDAVKRNHWQLSTGFIGTPRLLPGLHEAGKDDVAYRLLLQEEMPSWLFPVKNGATTVWERWNGWTPKDGYADNGMNSFNHYAFGSVAEYLYGGVGGIHEDAVAYKKIQIAPVIRKGMTWAKVHYDSIQGRIESDWKVEGGRLTMDVTIPANTTATVSVPTSDTTSVTEGKRANGRVGTVKFLRAANGAAVFLVGSGSYHFEAAAPGL